MKSAIKLPHLLAAAMLAASLVGLAAEQGQMVRDSEVRKEPRSDADKSGEVDANTPVEILQHQGAWVSIRALPALGWVRMLSVRPIGGSRESGDSGARAMLNVARTGSSGAAVATGVRGLDKEDLGRASPNNAELQKLDQYSRNIDAAYAFGETQPALASRDVAYLSANGKPEKAKARR